MLNAEKSRLLSGKTLISIILTLFICTATSYSQTSQIVYDVGTNIEVTTGGDICADDIVINGAYSGGGTQCGSPLPVTMLSLTASVLVNTNNVSLTWITENEINNAGFEVQRMLLKDKKMWSKVGFVKGYGTTYEPKTYTFEDKKIRVGKYRYRLKQIDFNNHYEMFEFWNVVEIAPPGKFEVSQNYPNPSNPSSKIDFTLPTDARVTLVVFDITGRLMRTLLNNEHKTADYYTVEFDGSSLASGIYFYRLMTETDMLTKKMLLIK